MSQFGNILYRLLTDSVRCRVVLLSLFAFCILSVSLTYFALSMSKPFVGVTLSTTSQGWVVEMVDANGIAIQAGVREGDKPIEVNGQPAQIFLGKYEKAGVVLGRLIEELTVIDDHGQLKSVALKDSSPSLQSLIQQIMSFIV